MAPRILVLDDDQEILEMLELVLSEQGYEVGTTREAAIPTEYEQRPPDLILLDWLFHGQALGMEVLNQLKQHRELAQAAVIVCCGLGSQFRETAELLRGKGIGVLYKPFDLDQLDAAISAGLRSRRS